MVCIVLMGLDQRFMGEAFVARAPLKIRWTMDDDFLKKYQLSKWYP